MLRLLFSAPHHHLAVFMPDLPNMKPCGLDALFLPRAHLFLLRHSITQMQSYWYRNFYLLSIAYAYRLGLGPDLPRADEPTSGNLSRSVDGILTRLSLLTPAFSLLSAPHVLTVMLRRT